MGITEEGRSQWYEALRRQDSRQVSALLKRDPDLLKVGWGEEWRSKISPQLSPLLKRDPDPLKVGSGDDASQFHWKGKPWKERTALHVGVKRGNAELVEQVLVLCNVAIRRHSRTDRQVEGGSEGEADLSPEEIEEAEETRRSNAGLRLRKALSRITRAKHEGVEKSQEIDLLADAESKLQVNGGTTVVEHVQDQDNNVLCSLLMAKDGQYDLDAVAMAALNGKSKIFLMLLYAMGKCKIYKVVTDNLPGLADMEDNEEDSDHRVKLKEAVEEIINRVLLQPKTITSAVLELCAECLEMYENDLDFNFLPWQEYLFHFLFSRNFFIRKRSAFTRHLWKAIMLRSPSIWRFLLNLKDGQGRTPFHVAVDGNVCWLFIGLLSENEGEVLECALAACDGAGRTALHKALAIGEGAHNFAQAAVYCPEKLAVLLQKGWGHSVCELPFHVNGVSDQNGFHGLGLQGGSSGASVNSSPIYTAILHGGASRLAPIVQKIECKLRTDVWTEICKCCLPHHQHILDDPGEMRNVEFLTVVEVAALVGEARSARFLPLGAYNLDSKKVFSKQRPWGYRPWPALHIAANTGNYEMVKLLLDAPHSDPYILDLHGNTALHHALNVITVRQIGPHLLDYVSCEHIQSRRKYTRQEEIADDDPLVDRQGCINLLLEAGCDIFKTNWKGQPPYPRGKLSKNAPFRSWWYLRQAKVFNTAQCTLSSAANSIAVVATLVATASYVGPLQPPLGLAGDPSQIQDANLWVRIFIFCDSMSFFLAIVAVTFSLIPNLQIRQQPMKDEVRRTRHMVAISVTVLFPSIVFVLVAFISSSIAVVSANIKATGGTLTVTTASIGGLLCLVTFAIFSVRLLSFVFPRSERVRTIYNATNLEYLSWFASLRKSVSAPKDQLCWP